MAECERWLPIKGYDGIYEVSSFGQVRSLDRNDSKGRKRKGLILKPAKDKRTGYLRVNLCANAVQDIRLVHVLVAHAFLGEQPEGKEVGHIDHDGSNCRFDNLEYVTHAENMAHAARHGRMIRSNLSVEEIQDIREIMTDNTRLRVGQIAEILNVSSSVVNNIAKARSAKLIPNKDGTLPTPIATTLTVDAILALQSEGYSIPQIAKLYNVSYSTPYQALRRAGIHQPNGVQGTGRRMSIDKMEMLRQIEGLPLFLK